ncbi:MAG: 30S ribosome-binding factor RbfA [Rikenellaceae bacterium]
MQQQETTRQQKIASLIKRDIADIFLREASDKVSGALVSVTKVRVSPDLSFAKVYVSVFPFDKAPMIEQKLKEGSSMIRGALGVRVGKQLRIVPELSFRIDDSMEYVEKIERLIK